MRVDVVLHLFLAVALTVWIDEDDDEMSITFVEGGNEDSRLVRSDNISSVEDGIFEWSFHDKTQKLLPPVILTFNGTTKPLSDSLYTNNDERGDSLFSLNSFLDRDSLHGCSYFGFSSTRSKFLGDRDGVTSDLTRNSSTSDDDRSIALDMITEQTIFMPWISTNTQLVTRFEASDEVSDVDLIETGTNSSFAKAACLTAFMVTLTVLFSRNNSMRNRKKCTRFYVEVDNCSGGHICGETFPSSPGVGRRRRISSTSKSPSSFSRRGRIEYEPMCSSPVKNTKTKRLIRSKTRSGTWKRVDIDM